MANRRDEEKGENIVSVIFFAAKRFWVLILAIVVAFTACGLAYSYIRKPNYTATEKIVYKAQNTFEDATAYHINAMDAFVDTIVDFCDEDVVTDRANFYYSMYLNQKAKEGAGFTVADYIASERENDTYDRQEIKTERILKSNIEVEVTPEEEDNGAKFSFSVKYTDKDRTAAIEKLKILVFAIDMESRVTVVTDNKTVNKYFTGINNEIMDFGTEEVSSDLSKFRIILVAFILGVLAACATVYAIYLFDNTVKTKEELEQLTGASSLSYISRQGGNSNGRKKRA